MLSEATLQTWNETKEDDRNDMGRERAEEECELERETGFEPVTLALAILKRVIS